MSGHTAVFIGPPFDPKILNQQRKFREHLSVIIATLQGEDAPTNFNDLARFLAEAEERARQENTRSILS